ncbi:MAG TPA: hypothetical protein VMV77_04965 [Bacteroidales bacterium]|nr:hypothetical protein [Bacteroidales bacterium]
MDTQGLIDNRNIDLWNTLCTVCEINIQREKRSTYYVFSKNNKTIIYVPLGDNDPAYFTHELLHVFLRIKDVFIGAGLKLSIKESKVLSNIFSDNLIEHIGNCLDHIKMFPEFLKLGYDPEKFLSDYSENKLTKENISKIKKHFITKGLFKKVFYNATAIGLYIGKYFAAVSCPNKSIDYFNQLTDLKKIDQELYRILEDFIIAWNTFDFNDKDPITSGYHLLLFDFIDKLEKWANGKTIK